MNSAGREKVSKHQEYALLLLILYVPISCSLVGVLAYWMRLPSPVSGRYPFPDVFWHYANPFNSDFVSLHLPTLVFSLIFLLFVGISVNLSKPIISIVHIRVLLLILIVLITVFVKVFLVLGPVGVLEPIGLGRKGSVGLFLYGDVHLILLYLITYLPIFRKLRPAKRRA
jgi:hypothetical protein